MDKFYRCYYCEGIIKSCYIDNSDVDVLTCPICHQEDTLQNIDSPETIKQLKGKLVKEIDSCRFYQKMGIQLKDKLHRRNMQIKDLKVKLEPKCSINKNHTIVDKGYDCLECNTHYC